MWLMPCSSSIASVRSPIAGVHFQKAAAPKMMRVLMWPVRPKGRLGDHGPDLNRMPLMVAPTLSRSGARGKPREWNRSTLRREGRLLVERRPGFRVRRLHRRVVGDE